MNCREAGLSITRLNLQLSNFFARKGEGNTFLQVVTGAAKLL